MDFTTLAILNNIQYAEIIFNFIPILYATDFCVTHMKQLLKYVCGTEKQRRTELSTKYFLEQL